MPIYYKVIHGETIDKRKLKPFWIENPHDYLTYSIYFYGINGNRPELNFFYSNDMLTWTELNIPANISYSMNIKPKSKIYFKTSSTLYVNANNALRFDFSGNVNVGGNIMSLLYGADFKGDETEITRNDAFRGLFSNSRVQDARELLLPATTLKPRCYDSLFRTCSSLIGAPKLPATTLVSSCYEYMFSNCSRLDNITCLATEGINTSSSTLNWLNGVSSTGTFYKAPNATWPSGANGIPTGWTVKDV